MSEGGGKKAAIEGYKVGAKTGTSEKLPRRSGKYIASCMGFAPAQNPKVIALVLIDEPSGIYYGGTIRHLLFQSCLMIYCLMLMEKRITVTVEIRAC